MDKYTNNTNKIEIKSHDLRIMKELNKEYTEIKNKILEEIIEELKSLKKEKTK